MRRFLAGMAERITSIPPVLQADICARETNQYGISTYATDSDE